MSSRVHEEFVSKHIQSAIEGCGFGMTEIVHLTCAAAVATGNPEISQHGKDEAEGRSEAIAAPSQSAAGQRKGMRLWMPW